MTEKHWRSGTKALSWRLLGTIDTIFLSWLVSGKLSIAFSIGFLEFFTKMFLYYMHERIWNKITIGRHPEPKGVLYEI